MRLEQSADFLTIAIVSEPFRQLAILAEEPNHPSILSAMDLVDFAVTPACSA